MVHGAADGKEGGQVVAGDILQGASYPDAAGGLDGRGYMIISFPFIIEIDVSVALKSNIHGLDKKGIFETSVEVVLFNDAFQYAVDVIGLPEVVEGAVAYFLFQEVEPCRIVPVEPFELRYIPVDISIQYTLSAGYQLVIAYDGRIVGIDDPQFREVIMVIL
jgi:hypothetical protein